LTAKWFTLYWYISVCIIAKESIVSEFAQRIGEQPEALSDLFAFYRSTAGQQLLARLPACSRPLITGMGASYHAAALAAFALRELGLDARAIEASELVYYGEQPLQGADLLLFISQSGASAEVAPVLAQCPTGLPVCALTNQPTSPLARQATLVFPLQAGAEETVACKTYLNTLALLWLVFARRAALHEQLVFATCESLLAQATALVAQRATLAAKWLAELGPCEHFVLLGHGPQSFTARQAAMMLSEWVKLPALSASIGAFRHGLIEVIDQRSGVVIFVPANRARPSALRLADELASYGARVLLVEPGLAGRPDGETSVLPGHDLLTALLDVIPCQIFAEALARQRGVPPAFRHLRKVVQTL
jgi:glutamine---fructose-6-phosphate transaminase (isomerizing)